MRQQFCLLGIADQKIDNQPVHRPILSTHIEVLDNELESPYFLLHEPGQVVVALEELVIPQEVPEQGLAVYLAGHLVGLHNRLQYPRIDVLQTALAVRLKGALRIVVYFEYLKQD